MNCAVNECGGNLTVFHFGESESAVESCVESCGSFTLVSLQLESGLCSSVGRTMHQNHWAAGSVPACNCPRFLLIYEFLEIYIQYKNSNSVTPVEISVCLLNTNVMRKCHAQNKEYSWQQ